MRRLAVAAAIIGVVASVLPAHAANPGRAGHIAYADDAGGDWHIVVADAGGGHPRRLATPPWAIWPEWSPDGRWIAFSAMGDHDTEQIWVIRPDGSGLRELTHSTAANYTVSWSPGSDKLVTARDVVTTPTGDDLASALVVVPLSGGAEAVIYQSDSQVWRPSWSPRGDRIAFGVSAGTYDPTTDTDVYPGRIETVKPDGSGLTLVGYGEAPDYSPDGRQIAYDLPVPEESGRSQVHVMNSDGTGDRALSSFGWYGCFPSYAPDGRSVLIEAQSRAHGNAHLYRFSVTTGKTRQITAGPSDQVTISQQPVR